MTVNVLGIGGSTRVSSSAEKVLRAAARVAGQHGATVRVLRGCDLRMPLYAPGEQELSPQARTMLEAVTEADGLLIASPAYHGGVSGLLKNALDHIEELRADRRPYLSGRAVGCLTVAQGWQSGVSTLAGLRTVVHALRGWPTPLGVVVNTTAAGFDEDERCTDKHLQQQIETMVAQVVGFARR